MLVCVCVCVFISKWHENINIWCLENVWQSYESVMSLVIWTGLGNIKACLSGNMLSLTLLADIIVNTLLRHTLLRLWSNKKKIRKISECFTSYSETLWYAPTIAHKLLTRKLYVPMKSNAKPMIGLYQMCVKINFNFY